MGQSNLHPWVSSWKAPAQMEETQIPMVIHSWCRVTRRPRMAEGEHSATYTGTTADTTPGLGGGGGRDMDGVQGRCLQRNS